VPRLCEPCDCGDGLQEIDLGLKDGASAGNARPDMAVARVLFDGYRCCDGRVSSEG